MEKRAFLNIAILTLTTIRKKIFLLKVEWIGPSTVREKHWNKLLLIIYNYNLIIVYSACHFTYTLLSLIIIEVKLGAGGVSLHKTKGPLRTYELFWACFGITWTPNEIKKY